jgi:outer membrane protein TolC
MTIRLLASPVLALLAAVALAPLAGVVALGQPPRALTEADAMRAALARHPALVGASGRMQSAVGRARRDAAFANPVLDWRRENLSSPLQRDEFLTVTLPVDVTGRRLALRGASRAVAMRAHADSSLVAREVALGAARAWWRATLARTLLDLAVEQRASADSLAAFDSVRCREGAGAEVVVLRTRAEAGRARLAEATARGEWHRAMAGLATAMATATDSLPELAPPSAPETTAIAAPVIARALAGRLELAALRAVVDEARHRASAAQRGAVGDVALTGGSKRTGGFSTRLVGIAVALPLFDAGGAAREEARGALRAAEADLAAAERAIAEEVGAAVGALRALQAAAPRDVGAGAEAATITVAAYQQGGASLLEVLEARRAASDQRAALARWRAELRLAQLELARAEGRDITNDTTAREPR